MLFSDAGRAIGVGHLPRWALGGLPVGVSCLERTVFPFYIQAADRLIAALLRQLIGAQKFVNES